MTVVTAACVVGSFAFVLSKAFTKIRPIFRERGKINAEVTGRLTESLGGVRVVKGYHAEEREAEVFGEGVQRLLDNVFKSLTVMSVMSLSATVLMGIVGASIMYVGARQIAADHIYAGRFRDVHRVSGVPDRAGVPGGGHRDAVARKRSPGSTARGKCCRERPEDQEPSRTVAIGPIQGTVEFKDVDFSYEAGKPVLFDVSFHAEPGTVTALVGPSGSGKSTIISLVAAFHTPTSGTVTVDGIDLSTVRLDTYRTQLGVVLQDTFLFDGTIEENIAFARPGATKEQILEACRIARVDEFAEKFEKKYDTIVGERGVKLSGGQRQRVSIARAILADPRILILDEATSSLDSESEALIQEGLKYLMQGRTTFVIAHRLVHHPARRPDSGGRGRADRRARHARIAVRAAGALLGSVHAAARPGSESVSRAGRRRHGSGRERGRPGSRSRRDWPKRCACCAAARIRIRPKIQTQRAPQAGCAWTGPAARRNSGMPSRYSGPRAKP